MKMSRFPFSLDAVSPSIASDLVSLSKQLMDDLKSNAEIKTRNYAGFGPKQILTFFARKSKHIMDEIDVVLGRHYNLDYDEVAYLSHYAVEFRLGVDNNDE